MTVIAVLLATTTFSLAQDDPAIGLAQTAVTAQNAEDYVAAAKLWEEVIEKYSSSPLIGKAFYNAGLCRQQTAKYEPAIDHFANAISKLGSDNPQLMAESYLYKGFCEYRLGQNFILKTDDESQNKANEYLTTSTETYAKLLQEFPNYEDADQACFFQAGAFEELRRLESAERSYLKMFECPKQHFRFQGLLAIGNINEQLQNYPKALEYYEKFRLAAKEDGGHSQLNEVNFRTGKTILAFAESQIDNEETEPAKTNYKKAVDIFKGLADQTKTGKDEVFLAMADEAQYQQAYCTSQLGDFEGAAQIYERVAARKDSAYRAKALINAGRSFDKADKYNWAVAAVKRAVAMDSPESVEAARVLSSLYLKNGDLENSYKVADEWIGKAAGSDELPGLMMNRAESVYRDAKKKADSPKLYLELADQFPNNGLAPDALYNAAFALLELEKPKQAIEIAERFEGAYPGSKALPDLLEVKADSLLDIKDAAASEAVFEKLQKEYSDHKKIERWIVGAGLTKYVQGNYKPAIDSLTENLNKIESASRKAEALHWIGSSQFQLKEYENATKSLKDSIEADSQWRLADETLLTLARSLFESESDDQAKTYAQKLIEKHEDSPLVGDAYYYLGESAYEAKEFEQALEHQQKVIKEYSESTVYPYSLSSAAWSNLKLEKYDESDKLFTKLITDFPGMEVLVNEAKIGRGAARRKTGKVAESKKDIQDFLKTNPVGKAKFDAMYELGLAHVEEQSWPDAIKSFTQLLDEHKDSDRTDRYRYELAWAYESTGEKAKAIEQFSAIANETPDSSFAPEANFHVGTDLYNQQKYAESIKPYQQCLESESSDAIREKAAYKLAWAHYKQDQFAEAADEFTKQTTLFPSGGLFADGVFMTAEAKFRMKQYDTAFSAYMKAKPIVDASETVDEKIKLLTRLHGAQSGNKTKQYKEALDLALPLTQSNSEINPSYQQDAWLEIGTAQEGLKQNEEALSAWRKASGDSTNKTAARARCMIGDMFFRQKKFDQAIDEFKRVYYGFGGTNATDEIKPWQAYALYESARCSFVQVGDAPKELKPELVKQAIKQFEYLIKNYGNDRLAPEAKKQLEILAKLPSN